MIPEMLMNPHNRVDIKYNIHYINEYEVLHRFLDGKFITFIAAETPQASSDPSQALTAQAADWENVLVHIVIIVAFFSIEHLLVVWPS
jgi:hypothetical protein